MNIAFLIYRYFPYGGQQRNMLAMALAARDRGHRLRIYCHQWQGERPEGLEVVHVPVRGWANHTRMRRFGAEAHRLADRDSAGLRVGFIKLPRLDLYYAADPCFAEKARNQRGWLYRLAPRTRAYLAMEEAVFGPRSGAHILEVSRRQRESYVAHYGTDEARFHTLIPGISRDRVAPADYLAVRGDKRRELGLSEDDKVMLALGSGFRTKGLDRSIATLAQLRGRGLSAQLLVVGQDNAERFRAQARQLGVAEQVRFLGGRDDVPQLLQAADAMIHPAYRENTGNGLLEAMIGGLPVVVTATCGYSHFVSEGQMGTVVADDASPVTIADAVAALWQVDVAEWHRRGTAFAETADIYDRPLQCVDIMEQRGAVL